MGDQTEVTLLVLQCTTAWERDARILGNITAGQLTMMARKCIRLEAFARHVMTGEPGDVEEWARLTQQAREALEE